MLWGGVVPPKAKHVTLHRLTRVKVHSSRLTFLKVSWWLCISGQSFHEDGKYISGHFQKDLGWKGYDIRFPQFWHSEPSSALTVFSIHLLVLDRLIVHGPVQGRIVSYFHHDGCTPSPWSEEHQQASCEASNTMIKLQHFFLSFFSFDISTRSQSNRWPPSCMIYCCSIAWGDGGIFRPPTNSVAYSNS